MNFYIIDDEIGTVKTLENIVEARHIGEVLGYNTDPEQALNEIVSLNPNIVMVDLLMSKMDGVALVDQIKTIRPNISFVMISQVADKSMVEQAYKAGVEFFIHKPINVIEVERVLNNVSEKVKMNSIMNNIQDMFSHGHSEPVKRTDAMKDINVLLGLLGMMGEKGTRDIVDICRCLIEQRASYSKEILLEFAALQGETPKNLEQRIRRAIKKGLTNVANLGIDDYSNEVFQIYANYVFDFKYIRDEMDYIKGLSTGGGRINISKFIEGLLLYQKSQG
ncbi:two-component system response regulator YcbB [Clostridiales Family XIII bacterium PM5-7]